MAFTAASSGLIAAGTERLTDQALGIPTQNLSIEKLVSIAALGAITGIAGASLAHNTPVFRGEPNPIQAEGEVAGRLPDGYTGIERQLPLPSEGKLPISSLRYSQSTLSPSFAEGPKAGRLVTETAGDIRMGDAPQYPVTVFIKTPEMDTWPMLTLTTRSGKMYTGSWNNLENYKIYVKNNRGFTEAILSGSESVNYKLATTQEVIKYSYQYDTPNGGTSAVFKDTEGQGIVRVPGQ